MNDYTPVSEAALLDALRAGDDRALGYVYQTNWPMILRLIQHNSGTPEDARDVYQDAIIHLYGKLKQPDFTLTCQVRTYLYAVCRYTWLKRLRGNRLLRDTESLPENLPDLADTEPASPQLPPDEQIQQAVADMGEPCRSILMAFYYEKLSLIQIAQRMQYASDNVVKQQKFRCIERLKKLFLSAKDHERD